MRITRITASAGVTKSVGDYSNLRADVTLDAVLEFPVSPEEARMHSRRLQDMANELVAADIAMREKFATVIRKRAEHDAQLRHWRGVFDRQTEYLGELVNDMRRDESDPTVQLVRSQIAAASTELGKLEAAAEQTRATE